MKNAVGIGIAVLATVVLGFLAFNSYIYEEKQGDGSSFEPYRATLSGETLCLPHTDTSGPQTLECAFGLRLDDGSYYAIDLNLMSQSVPDLPMGKRITASGVVTPVERLSSDHWRKYPIVGIFSVTDSLDIGASQKSIELKLGETGSAAGVTITPISIVEDSRCPLDVQCIQAGTVRLRATLESGLGKATQTFTLNQPITTEAEEIILVSVLPQPKAGEKIEEKDYVFTFEIKKREDLSQGMPEGVEPVFCTADAMQCPDGSWVGRTGLKCEFVCL